MADFFICGLAKRAPAATLAPMSMTWLADVDAETCWAYHPWTEFGPSQVDARALAVLPVFGFAEHGLGLPLDAEEILGSHVLKIAATVAKVEGTLRVLPPLRFALTPYPSGFFGIDAETLHNLIMEMADGVKRAGFAKLLFLVTSPWNLEMIDATSRDVREAFGLETFFVSLARLGLNFHPASEDRAKTQAAAASVSGNPLYPVSRDGEASDANFRPGNFAWPASLPRGGAAVDGAAAVKEAGGRLAQVLSEIFQWPDQLATRARAGAGKIGFFPAVSSPPFAASISSTSTDASATKSSPSQPAEGLSSRSSTAAWIGSSTKKPAFVFADENENEKNAVADVSRIYPDGFRERYLPALNFDALEKIPNKNKAWVIIPTGAIEQHGPHLPVGVDAMLGHAWVTETLRLFPAGAPLYVAPAITFGKSTEHVGFSGTISISGKTLRGLLIAIAAQLKALGFRQIALLNSHGGNTPMLIATLREIQSALGLRAGLLGQPYKPDVSAQEAEMGFHAGEWETSLMLAIASEVVAMDKAVCEFPAKIDELGLLRLDQGVANISWMTADISKSGVMGDATAATKEKGERWLRAGAEALAQKLFSLDRAV